jgi:TolA-binding protein
MKRLLSTFILSGFLCIAVTPSASQAQTYILINDQQFRDDARMAIDSLYNRNNEAARDILEPWRETFSDHPIWSLWDGMELWWNVLEDLSDDQYDEEFFGRMKKADYDAAQVLRKESDHPDALIIRAVANGYTARHHSNRGDWFTSANIGRRAYQAYTRLMTITPDLPDNDFAEGMKKYYAAYLPENYPVVRAVSWFLPDGDKEGGIESLKTASENGIFARPEATYFLGNILLNYEHRYSEASVYFAALVGRYPDNGYYRRLYVRSLTQMRRYSEAIDAAEETLTHWDEQFPGQKGVLHEEIYYWLGRARYYSDMPEEALEAFTLSYSISSELPNSRDREFRTLAAYFAGIAFESMNQKQEARRYYEYAINQRVGAEAKKRARERLDTL